MGYGTIVVQNDGMGGWLRLAATSAVMFTAWRWLRNSGSTPAERWMILPGDELIRDPADMTTLAVPIEARPQPTFGRG